MQLGVTPRTFFLDTQSAPLRGRPRGGVVVASIGRYVRISLYIYMCVCRVIQYPVLDSYEGVHDVECVHDMVGNSVLAEERGGDARRRGRDGCCFRSVSHP